MGGQVLGVGNGEMEKGDLLGMGVLTIIPNPLFMNECTRKTSGVVE